ncbi:hypothetical protein ABZW11_04925 [Nonomuraea sp. NPDC004580]|uniref:hypothetical protein n=1 Tax=Nonomuraea sp. NPDC004580 TaxID=3154552 RepID=UPI0033A8772E
MPSRDQVRAVLTVAGLACLVAAAWVLHLAAGLAVAGVCLLVVEYLAAPASEQDSSPKRR